MEKYKICPGCGIHNNPLAIECSECGEDLSTVRILDAQTENQVGNNTDEPTQNLRMVRICENCETKNDPHLRKCTNCGDDISMVVPTPDEDMANGYSLATIDGEYTFAVKNEETITIGRECELQDVLTSKMYVSRRHAEVKVIDGKLFVNSFEKATNGTYVNGISVSPEVDFELNNGDLIGLGGNNPDVQKEAAYFKVIKI